MGRSGVEWTTDSLNPVRGCWPESAGCANCYAMRLAATRLRNHPKYKGLAVYKPAPSYKVSKAGTPKWTGEVQLDIDVMREVQTWQKPRTCFLCDMSDLFWDVVPFEFIDQVMAFVANAPHHRFYILTKRAARMREYFTRREVLGAINVAARELGQSTIAWPPAGSFPWPLPNLWVGVSAEDQATADERIPHLIRTPAAVKFVSYEPALECIDFDPPTCQHGCDERLGRDWSPGTDGVTPFCNHCESEMGFGAWLDPLNDGISWVVAGAESGPKARAVDVAWARSVRDQCAAAGVAFYLKQWPAGEGIEADYATTGREVVVKLPRLEGVQHTEFPEARP